jgi:hypothetical protein
LSTPTTTASTIDATANDTGGIGVGWTFIAGLVIVSIVAVLAAVIADAPSGEEYGDAAAIIALITFTAVGIERSVEIFWTIVGSKAGQYWPLTQLSRQLKTLSEGLDARIEPLYRSVDEQLESLKDDHGSLSEEVSATRERLTRLQVEIDRLRQGNAENLSVRRATDLVSRYVAEAATVLPANDQEIEAISRLLGSMEQFVDSFADNPGRRLISLWLGIVLGIVVAAWLQLDLFLATLGTDASMRNVIITGVVIGLGSNPAHEIIRAIQEVKESRKAATASA